MRVARLIVFLVLLCLPSWAMATTYYVRTNGTASGCVPNTDTVAGSRSTITSGSACLSPGDTLMVHGGTYTGHLELGNGGNSWSNPVTIRAVSGETVWVRRVTVNAGYLILDGINIDSQYADLDGALPLEIYASHVKIQNLAVTGSIFHGLAVGNFFDDVQFFNLDVHHNGITPGGVRRCDGQSAGECHGTYFNDATNILFKGGQYHHNEGYGIHNGNPGQIVDGANIHHNGHHGAIVRYNDNNLFINNIFDGNGSSGIWVASGNNNRIYNNTFHNNNDAILFDRPSATATVQNNILSNNSIGGTPGPVSNNLCTSSGTGCTTVSSNIGFVNTGGGNFRIALAGSPAVNIGLNLSSIFTTDADGLTRPSTGNWTVGAYEFDAGEPIGPLGLVQWLKLNNNTLDSSPNGFNGTASGGLTYGPPIVEGNSGIFNGVDAAITSPNNPAFRPPQFGMSLAMNATALPPSGVCRMISIGTTAVLGWNDLGFPFIYINNGPTITGTSSILTGLNEVLGASYDGTNLRLWRGASGSSAPLNVGQALSYGGSEVLAVGGVAPDRYCPVRADNVRFFDQPFDTASWQNIVNEVVPSGGMFTSHMRYYADAAEGAPLAAVDADLPVLPGVKLGIRFAIHNTGAQVTEFFPLWCSRNASAYVKVSKSFGSLGLRIADSAFVDMGQATTVPIPDPNGLPLDTFTPVPGQFVADTPNPSLQKTIGPNQHTEWEYRVETGSPATGGDFFDCVPRRESDVVFNAYNKITRLTLQSLGAPTSVRIGGVTAGGVGQ